MIWTYLKKKVVRFIRFSVQVDSRPCALCVVTPTAILAGTSLTTVLIGDGGAANRAATMAKMGRAVLGVVFTQLWFVNAQMFVMQPQ